MLAILSSNRQLPKFTPRQNFILYSNRPGYMFNPATQQVYKNFTSLLAIVCYNNSNMIDEIVIVTR